MTTMMSSTAGSTLPKKNSKPSFIGRLQPVASRVPDVPMVNFDKGGSDFRTPHNISSFGRQITSLKHANTAGRVPFGNADRFLTSESIGVGPNALEQMSSMRKQNISNRRSAESTSFGTSTRDGALKLYAVYTCKR